MEKKATWDLNAFLIAGSVFSILGLVYLVVGLSAFFSPEPDDAPEVFIPLGAVFFVVGIILLLFVVSRKRQADRLISEGRYVWGTITEFNQDYWITFFGRHPYIADVSYTDASGCTHIFHSRHIYRRPSSAAVGKKVRIYTQSGSIKPYYVDIEEALRPAP